MCAYSVRPCVPSITVSNNLFVAAGTHWIKSLRRRRSTTCASKWRHQQQQQQPRVMWCWVLGENGRKLERACGSIITYKHTGMRWTTRQLRYGQQLVTSTLFSSDTLQYTGSRALSVRLLPRQASTSDAVRSLVHNADSCQLQTNFLGGIKRNVFHLVH